MSSTPWIGAVLFLGAAVVYAGLMALVRRVDRSYPSTNPSESTWWFGYFRDATNLAGVGAFTAALHALGLGGPQALLLAIVLTLGAYGLDYALARVLAVRHPERWLAVLLVALLPSVLAGRARLDTASQWVITAPFEGTHLGPSDPTP